MPRRTRRLYRRCPECSAVRLATELPRITNRRGTGLQYRCPSCGYIAPHWAFTEVEPPEEDGGAGSEQDRGNV